MLVYKIPSAIEKLGFFQFFSQFFNINNILTNTIIHSFWILVFFFSELFYFILLFFFYFNFFFFIIIIFLIVVDFVIHWNETAMGLHVEYLF